LTYNKRFLASFACYAAKNPQKNSKKPSKTKKNYKISKIFIKIRKLLKKT